MILFSRAHFTLILLQVSSMPLRAASSSSNGTPSLHRDDSADPRSRDKLQPRGSSQPRSAQDQQQRSSSDPSSSETGSSSTGSSREESTNQASSPHVFDAPYVHIRDEAFRRVEAYLQDRLVRIATDVPDHLLCRCLDLSSNGVSRPATHPDFSVQI